MLNAQSHKTYSGILYHEFEVQNSQMIEDEIRVHHRSIGKTLRGRRQSSCRQECSREMGSHPAGHLELPIGLRRI